MAETVNPVMNKKYYLFHLLNTYMKASARKETTNAI